MSYAEPNVTFKTRDNIYIRLLQEGKPLTLRIPGTMDDVTGYIVLVKQHAMIGGVAEYIVVVKPTGPPPAPPMWLWPGCVIDIPLPQTLVPKQEALVKVKNRFYVAAERVTSSHEQGQDNEAGVALAIGENINGGLWTRKTIDAAIAHAEAVLEANPKRDHVAVVRIVRIVRRRKMPVVVEVVA